MVSPLTASLVNLDTEFMNGLGWQREIGNIQYALELGADSVRVNLFWHDIEPFLLPKNANYDTDWQQTDDLVNSLVDANLRIIARIGTGFIGDTPFMENGEYLNPDIVGQDDYIYYVCRHIRNLVYRYRDRIHYWSIEAELNEAPLTVLFGWRDGNLWKDEAFLTNLVQSMYNTVKSADHSSQVIVGFHTDIHENIHHHFIGAIIAGSKSWKDWLWEWEDFMDIVGLHTYPNYYMADPILGWEVGLRVEEAMEITNKPVMVTETGYPAPKPGDILPDPVDFTEEKQAQYIEMAFDSAKDAGSSGFFVFGVKQRGVRNDYSAEDLDALRILGPAFHDGDVETLIRFVTENMDYCENELPGAIENADLGLCIVREDGSKRPAFFILRDKYMSPSPDIQRTQLAAGWNMFSLSTQPGSADIDVVLESIDGKYKMIWTHINGTWLWYAAAAPDASNLQSIETGQGYWIEMLEPAIFALDGTPPDTEVCLKEGWNLVGYSHCEELNIENCMNSLSEKYRSVWAYDPFEGWQWHIPDAPMSGNLHSMQPGFAYWIDATEDCIWDIGD